MYLCLRTLCTLMERLKGRFLSERNYHFLTGHIFSVQSKPHWIKSFHWIFYFVIENNVSSVLKHFSLNWAWSESTVCTKPVNVGMHYHLQTSTCCDYLATKERVQGPDPGEKPRSAHVAFTQGLELAQGKKGCWERGQEGGEEWDYGILNLEHKNYCGVATPVMKKHS